MFNKTQRIAKGINLKFYYLRKERRLQRDVIKVILKLRTSS